MIMKSEKKHWLDAIQMMDGAFMTNFIGEGLGSYPRIYFWRNSEHTLPATYSLSHDENINYLKLGSGDTLYMEQIISVLPDNPYLLSFDMRSNSEKAVVTIPICEKSLLYSFDCIWERFSLSPNNINKWEHFEKLIDSKSLGSIRGRYAGKFSIRPVKLSLYNGVGQTILDIKNIKLIDKSGINLIRNGDFSNGLDQWFFSTDNHLPWHIKNVFIQILFEQGWLGEVAFISFLIYVIVYNLRQAQNKKIFNAVILSSISGFITVGMVDSPFDEPRLTLLFFLILFSSIPNAFHQQPRFISAEV